MNGPALDAAWRRPRTSVEGEAWRANPFYRLRLGDHAPDSIAAWGSDPRPGDPSRGREIVSGIWRVGAERMARTVMIPWREAAPSRHFAARLHAFAWLADLAALGTAQGAQKISALIEDWVEAFGDWDDLAWDAGLTAERVFAWLCHGRDAFERGDPASRAPLMRSIGRQARLLLIGAGDLADRPTARLKAGAALVLAGLAQLPEGERLREAGEEILIEECAKQFLADGAHQSRAPEMLADCLFDLTAIVTSSEAAGHTPPAILRETCVKLSNMARMMRLGDGRLGCFQGGGEGDAGALDRAIEQTGGQPRKFVYATHAGFQRMDAEGVSIVFDVGGAPAFAYGEHGHAGALAFEMSVGAERLIVNVGSSRDLAPDWRLAARTTAAHSTLTIADALSSGQETRGRNIARFFGPKLDEVRRNQDEAGVTVQARHDGYKAQFGLLHRRYIFMDHAGANVRGIDELIRPMTHKAPPPKAPLAFVARFHLHPHVHPEQIEKGAFALRLASGALWRFRTDAEQVEASPSVYFGARGAYAETTQLVLSGYADPMGHGLGPPNRIRWALTRA